MQLRQAAVAVLLLVVSTAAAAQQTQLPTPASEHPMFRLDEGTWDAFVEIFVELGEAPMRSKGFEKNTIGCGGLCLISDFEGEMTPGLPFHRLGSTAYDPAKKKYVGTWNMSTGLLVGESIYDAAARSANGWVEGPDMMGQPTKMKSVLEYKDANTRVFSMYGPAPGGKESMNMRITYTRRP